MVTIPDDVVVLLSHAGEQKAFNAQPLKEENLKRGGFHSFLDVEHLRLWAGPVRE